MGTLTSVGLLIIDGDDILMIRDNSYVLDLRGLEVRSCPLGICC